MGLFSVNNTGLKWRSLQPPDPKSSRRGRRNSPAIKVTDTRSCPVTGGSLKVLTTECEDASRNVHHAQHRFRFCQDHKAHATNWFQKSSCTQRQGTRSSHDAKQEILRRNRPWCVCQEPKGACRACSAIVYPCH